MNSLTVFALVFCVGATFADSHGPAFCYRDAEGCGPGTAAWAPLCHEGTRQSPISLPSGIKANGKSQLRLLDAYKGDFFRISNNGHSIAFDFVGDSGANEGPSSAIFRFPDPLDIQKPAYLQKFHDYKFSSAHFHWGADNNTEGSEHCIGSKCFAMELHFVHYSANYSSLSEAVASGKGNALAVLGVSFEVSRWLSAVGNFLETGNPVLEKIIAHLDLVAEPTGEWIRIDEEINFTSILTTKGSPQVYTYQGSLTTPGCNEQVNWFYLKNTKRIIQSDLTAFRTGLLDSRGERLDKNNRPLQPINGRQVLLTPIIPIL